MITATPHGEVLQIKMSRYPDFPPATWVCAYLVDGLLIDTGPAYLMELGNKVDALYNKGMQPEQIMKEIFGEENVLAGLTHNQFSSLNMVKSFLRKYE